MGSPTGAISFLFTDIEGSTRLWEDVPEVMRAALVRHDALLRASVESCGGRVFKTVGDAFCVAFPSTSAAVEAAMAAQQALQAEPWPEEVGALRVRMAIHSADLSEIDERDGDYFGPPLNRVARLVAIGHGGQVLLSSSAHAGLQGRLPSDCTLRDMQSHRLKDLLLAERVWQLDHAELLSDFPPLRSLQSFANNLPSQLTTFIGRTVELQRIRQFLEDAASDGCSARLMTLTGSGGSGKTRLALQAAADRIEAYGDGVWLAELANLKDPALVPQTVARAVGLRDEPRRSPTEVLVDHLASRRSLILLDNCEHLIDAAASLALTLLRACPVLTVLATSREPLRVGGEALLRVSPLPLPARDERAVDAAALMEFDSVRLFVERARRVTPAFQLHAQNSADVVQICRRLDGIPLAIELAAALTRSLRPAQIAERLDDRFRLLTIGDRTVARHETLQAVIQWSYDLLSPAERRLFHRLGVFAGSWSAEATEAICGDSVLDSRDVLPHLLSLADKSLVVVQREESGASDRYGLLETVREFARKLLADSGEEAEFSAKHAGFYLQLAETAEPRLSGPDQAEWLNRLEAEHDNLRAAVGSGQPAVAVRLCGALWRFWHVRGHWNEGRRYLEEAVAPLSRTGGSGEGGQVPKRLGGRGDTLTPSRRCPELLPGQGAPRTLPSPESGEGSLAKALHGLGTIAYTQGDYGPAKRWLSEALKIRRRLKDAHGVAATLNNLGAVARDMGDATLARKRFEESLKIRRRIGDRSGEADCLVWLGNLAYDQRQYAVAESCFSESLAIYQTTGDRRNAVNALRMLGVVALEEAKYESATHHLQEALSLVNQVEDRRWSGLLQMNLANLARLGADFTAAHTYAERSLAVMRSLGDRHCTADCLASLGAIALEEGRGAEEETGQAFLEALSLYRAIRNHAGIALALEGLAGHLALGNRYEAAARLLGVSAAIREAHGVEAEKVDGALRDLAVTAARSALDDATYDDCFRQGRSQPVDIAVASVDGIVGSSSW